ncbi:hypothetical protein [Stenotrophomonas africana]|nr:hypothetical protein [Stenotrophomonas maltophilia]NNH48725.1 hypothetical protein [Stenotrophomonas maltophilia]
MSVPRGLRPRLLASNIESNSNSNSNSGLVGSVLLRGWRNGVDMQGTP